MNQAVLVIENSNSKEEMTDSQKYFFERITTTKRFKGWTLYKQPTLNSMRPDFMLVHPDKGILIIEVKDWDLKAPHYLPTGQVLGANGNYFTDNPLDQVTAYKDLILKYELDTYLDAVDLYSSKAFEMITPVIYFHKASRKEALEFTGKVDVKECLVWSKTDLDDLCSETAQRDDERFLAAIFFDKSKFARGPEKSMQKLVAELESMLGPNNKTFKRKRPLQLTREQDKLMPIQKGSIRRWGGVAGSGKTVIIATKAAEAVRQGQRVLILTYNITLRHYIRDLCSQQFVGENRRLLKDHLTIAHFDGFLQILMVELGIKIPSGNFTSYTDWAMELLLEKINANYPKHLRYDSIFIDEGQDFTGDWLRFIKHVYTYEGELLVMYDQAQSSYERQGVWLTDPDEIEGIGFRGQVGHLSVSHRLPNGIIYQIDRLSDLFGIQKRLHTTNQQIDLFTEIMWKNIDPSDNQVTLVKERVDAILAQTTSKLEDITVITMHEETGIEVVTHFEDLDWKVSHIYDLETMEKKNDDKWKFRPSKDSLKVSSYHSYKGWESSHVILLLEGVGSKDKQWQNMLDALYISLTRVSTFSNSRSFTCINNCAEFEAIEQYFD